MGMYDIINSEQVKCFPWITYQYDKNSDIRFWNHGGSLKNFNNTDAVPYRSLCYNYHKDFNFLDLHPTALPFDNGIVLHIIRDGKIKESITIELHILSDILATQNLMFIRILKCLHFTMKATPVWKNWQTFEKKVTDA